ncbi:Transcription factor bHLH68 [Zea mays]|uniref:Transcription factor bHLH68 n=1 Tax=Zea mays TaxID=4577 RepID=A0A1D6J9A3_MAIZE|nr:Transcription factor bHLH68 [Zea mays]
MCPARSLSTALRCAHPSLNPPARVGLVLSFPSTTSPPPSPGASSFSSPGYQDEITGRAHGQAKVRTEEEPVCLSGGNRASAAASACAPWS